MDYVKGVFLLVSTILTLTYIFAGWFNFNVIQKSLTFLESRRGVNDLNVSIGRELNSTIESRDTQCADSNTFWYISITVFLVRSLFGLVQIHYTMLICYDDDVNDFRHVTRRAVFLASTIAFAAMPGVFLNENMNRKCLCALQSTSFPTEMISSSAVCFIALAASVFFFQCAILYRHVLASLGKLSQRPKMNGTDDKKTPSACNRFNKELHVSLTTAYVTVIACYLVSVNKRVCID